MYLTAAHRRTTMSDAPRDLEMTCAPGWPLSLTDSPTQFPNTPRKKRNLRQTGGWLCQPPSLPRTDLGSPRDHADDAKPICSNIPIASDIALEPNVGFPRR